MPKNVVARPKTKLERIAYWAVYGYLFKKSWDFLGKYLGKDSYL